MSVLDEHSGEIGRTVVYGASDDLIEIEGSLREEFYATSEVHDEGDLLAFSTGVVLRVRYDTDGIWRITPLMGRERCEHVIAPTDDEDHYSDRVYLAEPPKWVVHGTEWAKS